MEVKDVPVTPQGLRSTAAAPGVNPPPATALSNFQVLPSSIPPSSSPGAVLDMIEAWARGAYLEVKSQLLAGGIASPAATVSAILEAAAASPPPPAMTADCRSGAGQLLPPPSPFLLAAASPGSSLVPQQQPDLRLSEKVRSLSDDLRLQSPGPSSEAFVIRRVSDGDGDVWGSGGGAEEHTVEQHSPLTEMAVMPGATPAGVMTELR